jgi:hypothetical protein
VNAAPYAHRVALRAGVTVLVPLLALWTIDRLDLALYATFGAFASVYGGGRRSTSRWRTQATLGAVLTLAVACGAVVGLAAQRSWLAIPVAAAWASAAAALSDRHRWVPPGPMFPLFAVATCAAIPGTPTLVLSAVGVAAGTAAVAVVLGVAEVGAARRLDRPTDPSAAPRPMPSARRQRIHLVRCGVVVLVAGTVATTSGVGHPYWAMVAAVTPLTVFTLRGQVARGIQRAAGTAVGLVLAAGLLMLSMPSWLIIVTLALLQSIVELLVVRHYGVALIFITVLALLSVQLASPQPVPELIWDRFVETLIGVGVGVVAAILTRNRDLEPGG